MKNFFKNHYDIIVAVIIMVILSGILPENGILILKRFWSYVLVVSTIYIVGCCAWIMV